MKTAAQYFGEELLSYLGVKEKALRVAPTEIIQMEARQLYQDFNFEMENGWWYHFEFESDEITEDDLMRFREYEGGYQPYLPCTGGNLRIMLGKSTKDKDRACPGAEHLQNSGTAPERGRCRYPSLIKWKNREK